MLEQVHFDEARQSQLPFIELLLNLGYKHITATEALRQRGNDICKLIFSEIAAIFSLQSGGAQPHVYPKDLAVIRIKLPSLKEKIEIAKIFICVDRQIFMLENKLSILKNQKKYLLNNLITGQIRTPENLSAKI